MCGCLLKNSYLLTLKVAFWTLSSSENNNSQNILRHICVRVRDCVYEQFSRPKGMLLLITSVPAMANPFEKLLF